MARTVILRSPGRKRKPEADFQRAIIQCIKACYKLEGVDLKLRGRGSRALLLCVEGCELSLELKSPKGTGRLGPCAAQRARGDSRGRWPGRGGFLLEGTGGGLGSDKHSESET